MFNLNQVGQETPWCPWHFQERLSFTLRFLTPGQITPPCVSHLLNARERATHVQKNLKHSTSHFVR